MLPKRSCTETDRGLSATECNLLIIFSKEFCLKCQLFCQILNQESFSQYVGINPRHMTGSCNYEVEGCGGSFAQAAPPTPGALSMMTPGSMPAESETWCFIRIMGEVGLGDFYIG